MDTNRSSHRSPPFCLSTRQALFLNSLLQEPLAVLIPQIALILVEEFGASPWQISVYTMLRPSMALLAFYFSSYVIGRPDRLIRQLLVTGFLCRLPFFLFPWIENTWLMIGCAAFYLMLSSSGLPAWMELLKINLPDQHHRRRLFSYSAAWGYLEGVILAIVFGNLLNHVQGSWRWLFPSSAFLAILSLFWQARIPVRWKAVQASDQKGFGRITAPWKQAFDLLRHDTAFRHFQQGFMACGAALMLVNVVLPHYLIGHLQVNYKEIMIATSLFKAIGYALSSRLWVRWVDHNSLFRASASIFLFVACLPLLLLAATYSKSLLWVAFTLYGVGTAGNHLIWHTSPTLFSAHKDSAPYSCVNVLMIGVRGLIVPVLGAWVSQRWGIEMVLCLSFLLCLASSFHMYRVGDRLKVAP